MSGRIKVAPAEDRTYQGIAFHSKREMFDFIKLAALERSGIVTELKRQVPFPIVVNGIIVCKWVADFTCLDLKGQIQVYDSKGMRTEMYKLKSKLFHACYPHLRIVEL